MFKIDGNKTIHINRGDMGRLTVNIDTGGPGYALGPDSFARLSVYAAGDYTDLKFVREVYPGQVTNTVIFDIQPEDTKDNIEATNAPQTFWYEIEIDPIYDNAQTLVGYDTNGPKLFVVYPEGVAQIEQQI